MMKLTKLFLVQSMVMDGQYSTKIQEIEVIKETGKQLKVEGINRAQINKSELNQLSHGWAENSNSRIMWRAFCTEEDKETILNKCISQVIKECTHNYDVIARNVDALKTAKVLKVGETN